MTEAQPVTMVVTYYRQPIMLRRQLETWMSYPDDVRDQIRIVVIDDGSPEPAAPIVRESGLEIEVYRVLVDIMWNQHGARNLGATVAHRGWMLMNDLDHVLLPESARELVSRLPDLTPAAWYRFSRRRTRQLEDGALETFPIKVPINIFLVDREVYWRAGGYDEDYCGCLCGSGYFHRAMSQHARPAQLDVCLDVYSANIIPDATTPFLPRGESQTDECRRRRREKIARGDTRPKNPLRFPWERVL